MSKNGEIKGLKKLLKDLVALGDEGREVVESVTMITAEEIARDAKIHAKVGDTGKLQQSIKAIEVDDLNWKVFANATGLAPYAAYVEFGTGGLVEVPDELKEMAIKFKGKGIKQVNLPARPFLYPAFNTGRKKYYDLLKAELTKLLSKV